MARRRSTEDWLERLRAVRGAGASPEGSSIVREALATRQPTVVAAAATLAGRQGLAALEGELVASFQELLGRARMPDKGCRATTALVTALRALAGAPEALRPDVAECVHRPGARHVQMEAVYGGRVDVAGPLRAASAAGLAECRDPQTLDVLADHLADPESEVRQGAARTLAWLGGREAQLLLRFKARLGDEVVEVHGETLRALLALDQAEDVDVVVAGLRAKDEVFFGEAALALGESQRVEVVPLLRHAWEHELDVERRGVLLQAIAMHRSEEAAALLLSIAGEASEDLAAAAFRALASFAHDSSVAARAAAVAAERTEAEVAEAYEEIFG